MSEFTRRLYGRLQETALLTDAITRVRQSRKSELVLISGAPGIGKSTLVRRALALPGAAAFHIASGKCELAPAATTSAIVQAVRAVLDALLVADHPTFNSVAERIRDALGGQGGVVAGLMPEAEAILGTRGGPAMLPAAALKEQLQQSLAALIRAIAAGDRPLVLFLDDLQWADALTLGVLTHLYSVPAANILIVATFRNMADQPAMPLPQRGDVLPVTRIALAPISAAATAELLNEALPIAPADLTALATAVHIRSEGNPLYIEHLLRSMGDAADAGAGPVQGGEDDGLAKLEGDVLAFMRHRLKRLRPEEKRLLRILDLLGGSATTALLSAALQRPTAAVTQTATTLMSFGLLKPAGQGVAFAHDQVLEAARLLSRSSRRPQQHARLARLMLRRFQRGEETLAAVAAQALGAIAGEGARLLRPRDQLRFARLLLHAGRESLRTGLVDESAAHIEGAAQLLHDHGRERRPKLAAAIELLRAESLLARGLMQAAEATVADLVTQDLSPLQLGQAYRLLATLRTMQSDYEGAIDAALEGVALLRQPLVRSPSEADCSRAYETVRALVQEDPAHQLRALPLSKDPVLKVTTSLLSALIVATFSGSDLLFTHVAKIVELTVSSGITPHSAYGLAWYGVMIASRYGRHEDGLAYAQAALEIVDRHGFEEQRTATLLALDQLAPWVRPFDQALEYARQAIGTGRATGDAAMSCYARNHVVSDLLQMGRPLVEAQGEASQGIALTRRFGFRDIEILLLAQLRLIEALRCGTAVDIVVPADEAISASTSFWIALYRGIEAYLFGDSASARALLTEAETMAWALPAHIDLAYLALFKALAHADTAHAAEALALIEPDRARLARWAALNPETFGHKLQLVEAEMARLRGEGLQALRLYHGAAAAAGRFVHERALIQERAARHCLAERLPSLAESHRRSAAADYRVWGAEAKARTLAPDGRDSPAVPTPRTMFPSPEEVLASIGVVAKAGTIERLLPLVLSSLMTHAGASGGILLLLHDNEPIVEAIGVRRDDGLVVERAHAIATEDFLAEALLFRLLRLETPTLLEGPDDRTATAGTALGCPLIVDGRSLGSIHLRFAGATIDPRDIDLGLIGRFADQAAAWIAVAQRNAWLSTEAERQTRSGEALRLARIELARTSQLAMMGGLAASIAHEVNQPLATIIASADASMRWLGRDVPDIPEAVAGLQGIRAGARRAADIIASLRSLARRDNATLAPLALDPLIEDVVRMTQVEVDALHVALRCRLRAADAQVLGDRVQLQQVMLNLITNALDALSDVREADRRIAIETELAGDALHVRVADSGHGIPAAVREQIFMPLYTTKGKGMGMGLAICRSIIDVHGGVLSVDAADGGGTVFRFSLPVHSI